MLGGAIAARDHRLLSFSHPGRFFEGPRQVRSSDSEQRRAAAISAFFVRRQRPVVITERQGGGRLA